MGTFWPWLLCHHSIQTLLSQASKRKIGKRCKKMRVIPWLTVPSAPCRQDRNSNSSRRSPVCGRRGKISQTQTGERRDEFECRSWRQGADGTVNQGITLIFL